MPGPRHVDATANATVNTLDGAIGEGIVAVTAESASSSAPRGKPFADVARCESIAAESAESSISKEKTPAGPTEQLQDRPANAATLPVAANESGLLPSANGLEAESPPVSPEGRQMNVSQILQEEAQRSQCGPKQCALIVVMIVLIGAAVWAINSQEDKLIAFAKFVADLGFFGHAIFFVILLWTGLPFGYNFSTTIVLIGFSYGWPGMIDAQVGTACSALLGLVFSRFFLQDWTLRWMSGMKGRKRLYLEACKAIMDSDKAGFLCQVLCRNSPLTFGLCNTFLSVFSKASAMRYLGTTMVGSQLSLILAMFLGIAVRRLGSISAATTTEEGRVGLICSMVVFGVVCAGLLAAVRYMQTRVLPSLVSPDQTIEVPDEAFDNK
jgi:uncharacterized membrane protein YdjX (TVP38/TMEM64 family)